MFSSLKRSETLLYRTAIAFAAAFWFAHLISLPLEITYDGLGYIDLADVLGSDRFPQEWNNTRTPLLPLSLKIAFSVFGRQGMSAILVPSLYGLAGILLLGASVKRVAGLRAAALTIALVSVFPTLVAYQHCVLTEAGTFFFVSLTVFLLVSTDVASWWQTSALCLALGVGYYWRQNILALTPAVAFAYGWRAVQAEHGRGRLRNKLDFRRIGPATLAQAFAILVTPFLLSVFWSPYLQSAALRDTSLRQGMLRQALLPPEHPFVGVYRDEYYRAIRSSLYRGGFLSGMRWDLMSELGEKIWARPAPKPIPRFFLDLAVQNPGRYLNAFGRTLVFYAGFSGAESDNRAFRGDVLSDSPGPRISVGPEPLRSRIVADFGQKAAPSLVRSAVRMLIPVFEPLLIIASMFTCFGVVMALWTRNSTLFIFAGFPCVYALSYAVMLVSLDRFMTPVYPVALCNLVLIPMTTYRHFRRLRPDSTPAREGVSGPRPASGASHAIDQ